MAVTWTITDYKRDLKQGDKSDVITEIHWTASDEDSDGNSGSAYGSCTVQLGDSFTEFSKVTDEMGIAWAKHQLGDETVKSIEDGIAQQIADAKTPTTMMGKPS